MWKATYIQRRVAQCLTALTMLFAAACVYSPESGTYFDINETRSFYGVASNPGADIRLYAFNKRSQQWVWLTTGTANNNPVTFNYDHIHYYFTVRHRMTSRADWRCFVHESCWVPEAGEYEVRFQLREVPDVGNPTVLFTYDEGGLGCWVENYVAGQDMYAAYWPCRAEEPGEVRLKTILTF